jgi:hypothetical protein
VAFIGFFLSVFSGYGMSGIAACSLLCEISSVFLNFKDMMFAANQKNSILS